MNYLKEISKVFESAKVIEFDDISKIVLMSDCHRGDGNWGDNYAKNQNVAFGALNYYYENGYTYIELGDGDELWENRSYENIKEVHSNTFWLLSKFYNEKRLHLIYGNHDMVKKNPKFVERNMHTMYDSNNGKVMPLFPDIKVNEGIILCYKPTQNRILLLHGHQGDYFNNKLWMLSRTLVRYLWRPLEVMGVNDPTRAAKNYKRKCMVERKLSRWSKVNKYMLIAGHTHRPVFSKSKDEGYFNDGSCVHPRCITAIEISEGAISLVKWHITTQKDGILRVHRDVLEGPMKLKYYFEQIKK